MVTRDDRDLCRAAIAVRDQAYAPYSGYRVGAAVRGESGQIYVGCNVENASFSLTCCAERVAVYTAITKGERAIESMCVVTADGMGVTPCGACRQVLAEFGIEMRVLLGNPDDEIRVIPLSELLPGTFLPSHVLTHLRSTHGGSDPSPSEIQTD